MTQSVPYKNYQVADIDNFKYYDKTRCLVSQMDKYLGTHLAILIGLILYYVFTAPYTNAGLVVITIIFHVLTFIVLIILAYKDPGILPKILTNFQSPQLARIPIDKKYIDGQTAQIQKMHLLTTKTHLLRIKFCSICCIYRPARVSHCYQCNVCVQRYDHHCPWIGTCVGKRNYRWFILFLIFLSALLIFIWIQNFIVLAKKDEVPTVAFAFNIILCIAVFASECFVFTLLGFHIYFTSNNITTYEYCKNAWETVSGNPFSKKGFLKNISKIFMVPNFKPKIDPKQEKIERNIGSSDQQRLNQINNSKKEGKNKQRKNNNNQTQEEMHETQRSVQLHVIENTPPSQSIQKLK